MLARPWQIPVKWLKDQHKLAQLPNFTDAMLGSLRSTVGLAGQRELLLYRLDRLRMPTVIVWGIDDRVLPYFRAKDAIALVQDGSLELISNCGHLPHVEQPKRFVSILDRFLRGALSLREQKDASIHRAAGKLAFRQPVPMRWPSPVSGIDLPFPQVSG
jgi:pimeloyl-ACP methyl ester carboxylesterase